MISATVFGRLTADPEQKMPNNGGNPYVSFSIASNTGKKDSNNNNIAQFINISVFGKQGESVLQYFHKGSRITAHIRDIEARAWVRQDGEAAANLNAVLVGFDFVDTQAESGNQPQGQQGYNQPQGQQQGYGAPPQGYAAPNNRPPANNGYAAPNNRPPMAPNYGAPNAAPPNYGGYAPNTGYAAPNAGAPNGAPATKPW